MIATSAEVAARDLRVLIDDQRIIIKPVHRIVDTLTGLTLRASA